MWAGGSQQFQNGRPLFNILTNNSSFMTLRYCFMVDNNSISVINEVKIIFAMISESNNSIQTPEIPKCPPFWPFFYYFSYILTNSSCFMALKYCIVVDNHSILVINKVEIIVVMISDSNYLIQAPKIPKWPPFCPFYTILAIFLTNTSSVMTLKYCIMVE